MLHDDLEKPETQHLGQPESVYHTRSYRTLSLVDIHLVLYLARGTPPDHFPSASIEVNEEGFRAEAIRKMIGRDQSLSNEMGARLSCCTQGLDGNTNRLRRLPRPV